MCVIVIVIDQANIHWDNANFHKDLAADQKNLAAFVQSWVEQRNYGVVYPIEALQKSWEHPAPPPHPLMAYIEQEFAAMVIRVGAKSC